MRRLLLGALCALVPATLALAATGYHVVGEIMIGGDGGWDYLTADSAARRLYVSHATHVAIVDLDSGKVVGDIPDTPGVHGIAVAPQLNRGFVSNGRTNTVTIFDLKTLKQIGQPVATGGMNPDSIRYEPVSQRVFAFNGRSNNATVIDAKTGMVAATIPLPQQTMFRTLHSRSRPPRRRARVLPVASGAMPRIGAPAKPNSRPGCTGSRSISAMTGCAAGAKSPIRMRGWR